MKLVLTCEHGGNHIPEGLKPCFKNQESVLNTHRGYDIGALDMFRTLQPLANYSKYSKTSRLLIELNRSLHHHNLFSEFTKGLPKTAKLQLIDHYYLPYRNAVEKTIKHWIANGETVLHLSVHSFTPILNGEERHCDIGLLYDSRHTEEKAFCVQFKKALLLQNPELNVRYNFPYLGKADGFTTYLRKQFGKNYLGIELEINQKYASGNQFPEELKSGLVLTLKLLLNIRA
ncbi:N-formylglutamate amidohydrolase [Tamlana crocina]